MGKSKNIQITGVLIDTVSIQDYIFTSNKLKENVGASYLVKNIYGKILKSILNPQVDLNLWEKEPETIKIQTENVNWEIGYIGGGKALILFKERKKAIEFIQTFTKVLLQETPGIRTAFGIIDDFSLENFAPTVSQYRGT